MKRATVGLLLLWSAAVLAQELPGESFQRRKVVASDGAALALYRYVPAGGGARFPPVLLIPDVGFARQAYDFQGCGLARYLQAKGRDTFILELRGQGRSSQPKAWSLRDWAEKDVPAALQIIGKAHPGPVDLVVQGYGGGIILAAVPVELRGRIGRVIALSTQVHGEAPNEVVAKALRKGGRFSQLSAPDFQLLFANDGLFTTGTAAEFRGMGVEDLSQNAAIELLAWMKDGTFSFSDGTTNKARLVSYDRPTLLLLPLLDNFAHPEHAAPLREIAKQAEVKVLALSKFDLLSEDYTHLSVLLGRYAEREVFEQLSIFLNETDGPAP